LRRVRAARGVGVFDLPPKLRGSLRRLEKLWLIKYVNGRWYPARRDEGATR
jgi:hypothetical protein